MVKWTRESLFKFSKPDISMRWNDYFEKLDANHSCIFLVIVTSILSAQNYLNSDQIIRFMKIYTDFLTVFLSIYSQENFQKQSSQQHQNFCRKFFRSSEKIGGFKIFCFLSENLSAIRFFLKGLSPRLNIAPLAS